MLIEIKNRFNGDIIIVGEYNNIKDAITENRGVDLSGVDLRRGEKHFVTYYKLKRIKACTFL